MATIELTADESLVLFDFLPQYATDHEPLEVRHMAGQIVLWDMCCLLVKQLVKPIDSIYQSLLEAARKQVSGEHTE
ncbi:hypothetical protein [Botrimarina sp.]|uniref:hypothetical protein n=1 Tax=Botrimarina sp. TaxID=2795802 RepID=UPI0032F0681C